MEKTPFTEDQIAFVENAIESSRSVSVILLKLQYYAKDHETVKSILDKGLSKLESVKEIKRLLDYSLQDAMDIYDCFTT